MGNLFVTSSREYPNIRVNYLLTLIIFASGSSVVYMMHAFLSKTILLLLISILSMSIFYS